MLAVVARAFAFIINRSNFDFATTRGGPLSMRCVCSEIKLQIRKTHVRRDMECALLEQANAKDAGATDFGNRRLIRCQARPASRKSTQLQRKLSNQSDIRRRTPPAKRNRGDYASEHLHKPA